MWMNTSFASEATYAVLGLQAVLSDRAIGLQASAEAVLSRSAVLVPPITKGGLPVLRPRRNLPHAQHDIAVHTLAACCCIAMNSLSERSSESEIRKSVAATRCKCEMFECFLQPR